MSSSAAAAVANTAGSHSRPQDVEIHVDAVNQTVTFKQRQSQFAVRADEVTVPIIAIETLYINLVTQSLRARGIQVGQKQMSVAEPSTGVGFPRGAVPGTD